MKQTFYQQTKRPEPGLSDRALLNKCIHKPKCPLCNGSGWLPVYAGDHTESRRCPECRP